MILYGADNPCAMSYPTSGSDYRLSNGAVLCNDGFIVYNDQMAGTKLPCSGGTCSMSGFPIPFQTLYDTIVNEVHSSREKVTP